MVTAAAVLRPKGLQHKPVATPAGLTGRNSSSVLKKEFAVGDGEHFRHTQAKMQRGKRLLQQALPVGQAHEGLGVCLA